MQTPPIDANFMKKILVDLLNIPSPSGYSDQIVHYVGKVLQGLEIDFEVTRRGAIRAVLQGTQSTMNRAVAVHLDTLGAMTRQLKENGRLAIAPVGTWSSRFAEGARVTIFKKDGPQRGTVLPLKASGHVFHEEIDQQPVNWEQIEVRVDEPCHSAQELQEAGYQIGDFIAFDAIPEITPLDYINARHLDDKAGVALVLAVAKAVRAHQTVLPVNCSLLFTISEEVGSGASSIVYGDVAEMVVVDHAPVAPGQASSEYAATICMMDQAGPFDYHLSNKLVRLCETHDIAFRKDVFRFYRSDSASAIEAGNDTRTALVGFGVDASHGYERAHMKTLMAVARLIAAYMQSGPTFLRDKEELSGLEGFPHQPSRDVIKITT